MKLLLKYLSLTFGLISNSQELPSKQDSIITYFQCPASFPEGSISLGTFLLKSFDYNCIETELFEYGTIYLTFIVDENGDVIEQDILNREKKYPNKRMSSSFKHAKMGTSL